MSTFTKRNAGFLVATAAALAIFALPTTASAQNVSVAVESVATVHQDAAKFWAGHKCIAPKDQPALDALLKEIKDELENLRVVEVEHQGALRAFRQMANAAGIKSEEDDIQDLRTAQSTMRGDAMLLKRIPPCVVQSQPLHQDPPTRPEHGRRSGVPGDLYVALPSTGLVSRIDTDIVLRREHGDRRDRIDTALERKHDRDTVASREPKVPARHATSDGPARQNAARQTVAPTRSAVKAAPHQLARTRPSFAAARPSGFGGLGIRHAMVSRFGSFRR